MSDEMVWSQERCSRAREQVNASYTAGKITEQEWSARQRVIDVRELDRMTRRALVIGAVLTDTVRKVSGSVERAEELPSEVVS